MKKYIIIGASAAGVSAAQTIRRLDKISEIIVISQERELPYNKCFLADYAAGHKDEIGILTPERADTLHISLMLGTRVQNIDVQKKLVVTDKNNTLPFDALLIATGARPYVPPIAGLDKNLHNIYTFHTRADIERMVTTIQNVSQPRALVIGAGLSGLECADALIAHGVAVTIVEQADQVLPNTIHKDTHEYIKSAMETMGVKLMCNTIVAQIKQTYGAVCGAILANGEYIVTDMIVFATGVRPNTELLTGTGIECENKFVRVNSFMQTNILDIYAAGDCALVPHQLTGDLVPSTTWPDAMHQGRIGAQAMTGNQKSYPGIVPIMSSAFFGIKFCSTGHDMSGTCIITSDHKSHTRLYVKDNCLQGFEQVGQSLELSRLRRLLLTQQELD